SKLAFTTKSGSLSADGDLTTLGDVDWYKFSPPAKSTGLTLTLKTAGISLLAGQISVYDANGNFVGSFASTGPLDGDRSIHISFSQPGFDFSTVYVKVDKAPNDQGQNNVFGMGSYELQVVSDQPGQTSAAKFKNPDKHTNDDPSHAVSLQASQFRSDSR